MRSNRTMTMSLACLAAAAMVAAAATPATASKAKSISKAKARTIAARINLHSSDLPGYSVQSYKSSSAATNVEKAYEKCVGVAARLVDVNSNAFTNSGGYGFTSASSFVASAAAAKRDIRRVASAHGRQCLKQTFQSAASGVGASSSSVTVSPLSEATRSGLGAIFAVKITASFTIFGYSATLHGYEIGFTRGNAEVELDEIGAADKPQSINDAPLAALISRAKHNVPAAGLAIKH